MDSNRRPGAFSPMFNPSSPPSPRSRSMSVDSNASSSSAGGSMAKRGPTPTKQMIQQAGAGGAGLPPPPSSIYTSPRSNSSTPVLQNYSRPTITHIVSDAGPAGLARKNSPLNPGLGPDGTPAAGINSSTNTTPSRLDIRGVAHHHKRNNSQGFFEPSLPTLVDSPSTLTPTNASMASGGAGAFGAPLPPGSASAMSGLTQSQIAAQAAMQSQNAGGGNSGSGGHFRKRSQTIPSPPPLHDGARPKAGSGSSQQSVASMQATLTPSSRKGSMAAANALTPSGGLTGPPVAAAAGAASAAFGQLSPGLTSFSSDVPTEKTSRSKAERAKQIFSKSKPITVPNNKEFERKESRATPLTAKLPSPGTAVFPKHINASSTNPNEAAMPVSSNAGSIYNMANSSTSTLVPIERMKSDDSTTFPVIKEKEKEKPHRTNIFSRPRKNKDKVDEHSIALSSASSNSKPVDPNAPQSIYSFTQASPAPSQTTFSKSVTGLDLRHAGRKKKDEFDFTVAFGQTAAATSHFMGSTPVGFESNPSTLAGFGLNNMSAEDAWDLLKAKILVIFEGEELKTPVEDLNRLVSVHIQRCIQRRSPVVIEDLRDLLNTGFSSLDMTLRRLQEDRLVPQLVDMWLFVFGTLLPYIQAVFLPLDFELRGHGTMSLSEAAEFWGFNAAANDPSSGPSDNMDVRKCVLLSFRDNVILPRHDALKQVFSRLSLESINVGLDSPLPPPAPYFSGGGAGSGSGSSSGRPGTAGSLDPAQSSFNSQGSTIISRAATASDSNRSRATSNTSSQPELPTFSPTQPFHHQYHHPHNNHQRHGTSGSGSGSGTISNHHQAGAAAGGASLAQYQQQNQQRPNQPDSSQVTETVGRVLQCMSVLVSVHSDDEAQDKMEDLTKTLKLNWLGRGRTGRNRKGLVGARVPRRATPVVA